MFYTFLVSIKLVAAWHFSYIVFLSFFFCKCTPITYVIMMQRYSRLRWPFCVFRCFLPCV